MNAGAAPRCPYVLSPQHTGVPSVLDTQVCDSPALMWVTVSVPAGIALCPLALAPQQNGVPSLTTHTCPPPAEIWVTAPSSLMFGSTLSPQHRGVPSVLIAQVCECADADLRDGAEVGRDRRA